MPGGSVKRWLKEPLPWMNCPAKAGWCQSINEDAVRELGLYSYRILYEIKSDHLIEVLAVIHKRQHVEADEIPRDQ